MGYVCAEICAYAVTACWYFAVTLAGAAAAVVGVCEDVGAGSVAAGCAEAETWCCGAGAAVEDVCA